jgi:hypothetical protein
MNYGPLSLPMLAVFPSVGPASDPVPFLLSCPYHFFNHIFSVPDNQS